MPQIRLDLGDAAELAEMLTFLTGWRAQHTLAAALPDSWIQGSSGTRYHLTAA